MGVQLPSEPITRKEQYLAKAAGQAVEVPTEPITREEAYLNAIAKGGGGGGTGDYDDLENRPKVNNVTLTGNMSASDLGLASEEDLAGKQDVLTKGQYVDITNKVISVQRDIARDVDAVITTSFDFPNCTVTKTIDEEVADTVTFSMFDDIPSSVMDVYSVSYNPQAMVLTFTNTVASKEHAVGYTFNVASYASGVIDTQTFVETVDADKKLIIQSELDAAVAGKVDKENGKGLSTNDYTNGDKAIVGGVTAALGEKADTDIVASDFSTATSYTAGAYCIYEGKFYRFKNNHTGAWSASDVDEIKIAGELSSLKSGFTTLDNEVNGDATVYPYADVITIEDAIPANLADCTVKIEPVQDLHGYDKPWPAGGGKNKFNLSISTQTVRDVTITVNDDGTFYTSGTASENIGIILGESDAVTETSYKLNGCPSGGGNNTYKLEACDAGGGAWYSDIGDGISNISGDRVKKVKLFIASGTNMSGKTFKPMVYPNSETDATFAPYTNICPITGHTEASVQRDGKNLFDENDVEIGTAWNGNANADRARIIIPCKPNTTYTFSMNGTNNTDLVVYGWFKSTPALAGNVSFPKTFTTESDSEYIVFGFNKTSISESDIELMKLQLEEGTKKTTYEPYAGKTYTIALGSTIYGGTVDFDSGVMTVTHGYYTVSNLSWTKYDSLDGTLFRGYISDIKAGNADTGIVTTAISSAYHSVANANRTNHTLSQAPSQVAVDIIDNDFDDAAVFKSTMGDVEICYELATPTTIQLTPQQIQLLKGQITLTASTGQISITVNGVSGSIGALQTQANDTNATLAELAEQLPTAPTTDGAYVLTVTVADGTPTYSWESAT